MDKVLKQNVKYLIDMKIEEWNTGNRKGIPFMIQKALRDKKIELDNWEIKQDGKIIAKVIVENKKFSSELKSKYIIKEVA